MYLNRILMNATWWYSRMKKHKIPFKNIPITDKLAIYILYGGLTVYSFSVVYLFYSGVHILCDISHKSNKSHKNIDKKNDV
jgi:hypothetical protein